MVNKNTRRILFILSLFSLFIVSCSNEASKTSSIEKDENSAQVFQEKNITSFGLRGTRNVVLTIDDGPTPGVTEKILDLLRETRVPATFFVLGKKVSGQESTLERMRQEGHIVASHTYSHHNLPSQYPAPSIDALVKDLKETHESIATYQNPAHRLYFRAPYGSWASRLAAPLNDDPVLQFYIGPVFWDIGGELNFSGKQIVSAADWNCWSKKISAESCADGYIRETERKQGGVILVHDVNIQTYHMLKVLIPRLKDLGYNFISLDEVRSLNACEFAQNCI